MKSQNAIATIGNITSCNGEDVFVPVDVVDFYDIGAMTFYIGYDTNTATFITLQNINPAIPGNMAFNEVNGQINIAYSNTNPFDLTEETLFELKFSFNGDSCIISFNPGTEIANSNLEVIPLDTIPGSIANSIQILNQPDSVQAYPDNDVMFTIGTLEPHNYQWQENTGSGWTDLQNNQTYSGVTNDTLMVHDVTLSFNGYSYRCVITEDPCTLISETALLEVALAYPVATLGQINSCPEDNILEPLRVGDFFDVVEFTFNISFDTNALEFQELQNIHPDLLPGNLSYSPLSNQAGISIYWNYSTPVSITSDKLFDLAFTYGSGNHIFSFEDGTQILNSFFNPIDITLVNGILNQHPLPQIINQPLNDTVTEPQEASFIVEANETTAYLWYVSQDNGQTWTALTDMPPYSGASSDQLFINPAIYEMNGYRYACLLQNENCSLFSSDATLVVDTLTFISSVLENHKLNIYPNPFHENLSLKIQHNLKIEQLNIFSSSGKLIVSYSPKLLNEQKIDLNLNHLSRGMFLLQVKGNLNGEPIMWHEKIMKVN